MSPPLMIMIMIPSSTSMISQTQRQSIVSSRYQSSSKEGRAPSSNRSSNSKDYIMKVKLTKDLQGDLKQTLMESKIKAKEDKIQILIQKKKEDE